MRILAIFLVLASASFASPPAGYVKDFDSNFDATTWGGIIDWTGLASYSLSNTSYPRFTSQQPDDRGNAGAAHYIDGAGDDPSGQPSPFSISSGNLYINTWESGSTWYTGMISTVDTNSSGFSAIGGYWEAKIQTPISGSALSGQWPAFWLFDLDTNQRANRTANAVEIDIAEMYGTSPTKVNQLCHLWSTSWAELNTGASNTFTMSSSMNQWHTYGCLVNTDYIHYFVDGVDVFETVSPTEVATHPLYAMIDAALQWGPTAGTTMAVQYLYHYQYAIPSTPGTLSTVGYSTPAVPLTLTTVKQ